MADGKMMERPVSLRAIQWEGRGAGGSSGGGAGGGGGKAGGGAAGGVGSSGDEFACRFHETSSRGRERRFDAREQRMMGNRFLNDF